MINKCRYNRKTFKYIRNLNIFAIIEFLFVSYDACIKVYNARNNRIYNNISMYSKNISISLKKLENALNYPIKAIID